LKGTSWFREVPFLHIVAVLTTSAYHSLLEVARYLNASTKEYLRSTLGLRPLASPTPLAGEIASECNDPLKSCSGHNPKGTMT